MPPPVLQSRTVPPHPARYFSVMVIPVSGRISRERFRQGPVWCPNSLCLSPADIPARLPTPGFTAGKNEKGLKMNGNRDTTKTGKNSLFTHKPVFPRNTGLPDNSHDKIHADLCTMRVGEGENEIAADHVRVFPAMEWAVKTNIFQSPYQFCP
jgi:hypothetical protein